MGQQTKILIPSGALGLGYDRAALARGVAAGPDLIAIDGGSTDSGPHYLGTGTSKYSRNSTKSEWRELMQARKQANVPLVIGTAGTCGADRRWTGSWISHERSLAKRATPLRLPSSNRGRIRHV